MSQSRRKMLLGSAAMMAAAACPWRARAQAPLSANSRAASSLYGTRIAVPTSAQLQSLSESLRTHLVPPRRIHDFEAYVENMQLLKTMKQDVAEGRTPNELYFIVQWNHFALDLVSLDHTKYIDGATPFDAAWAEQFGPARSSRALAIIHLAMAEAVNFARKTCLGYTTVPAAIAAATHLDPAAMGPHAASTPLAICWAAYDSMIALYPHLQGHIKYCLSQMQHIAIRADLDDPVDTNGTAIGRAAAAAVLALRSFDPATGIFGDGSRDGMQYGHPNTTSFDIEPNFADLWPAATPEQWQIDPISQTNRDPATGKPNPFTVAVGGHWNQVTPFVAPPGNFLAHFPLPAPPAQDSVAFRSAYDDVRAYGGDPHAVSAPGNARWPTPTQRSGTSPAAPLDEANETFRAKFWGYDGFGYLCAPPRLYNMIAVAAAFGAHQGPALDVAGFAQYLATVNTALAEAAIGAWTAKYHFRLARPVTWIREHDPDVTIGGVANRNWTPLGQVATNAQGSSVNTTPPFPSYPSGHAVFGGALFAVMRAFWKVPQESPGPGFTFVSDEYNGFNRDAGGALRPAVVRDFASFTAAEDENAQSRIWLGIHWHFDAVNGTKFGRAIGKHVHDHLFAKTC